MTIDAQPTAEQMESVGFVIFPDAMRYIETKIALGHQVSVMPVPNGWTVSTPRRAEKVAP